MVDTDGPVIQTTPTVTPATPPAITPAPSDETPVWPVIPPAAPHGYQQDTGEFIQ